MICRYIFIPTCLYCFCPLRLAINLNIDSLKITYCVNESDFYRKIDRGIEGPPKDKRLTKNCHLEDDFYK